MPTAYTPCQIWFLRDLDYCQSLITLVKRGIFPSGSVDYFFGHHKLCLHVEVPVMSPLPPLQRLFIPLRSRVMLTLAFTSVLACWA
uniref:Uncharacterized protein n=1 Tax=Anguilla anguilla TaxID=7936 RepID=A0A0E9X373_ANGAN